jgi:hypothetical protein
LEDLAFLGDLFWTAVLFGGAWAIRNGAMLAGRAR